MYKPVNIEKWNRRAAHEFFKNYEDPFFNMTANLDVTNLYSFCNNNGLSFSIASLFFSQKTLNQISEFKMRYLDDVLVEYEIVEATQTILQDDESFSFCHFEERDSIFEFDMAGKAARDKYKSLNTFEVENERLDLVYYSIIPWVSFTSFKHATRFDKTQTVPRIVFGKYFDQGNRKLMPLSVELNHRVADGIHVGKYFNIFQETIDKLAE